MDNVYISVLHAAHRWFENLVHLLFFLVRLAGLPSTSSLQCVRWTIITIVSWGYGRIVYLLIASIAEGQLSRTYLNAYVCTNASSQFESKCRTFFPRNIDLDCVCQLLRNYFSHGRIKEDEHFNGIVVTKWQEMRKDFRKVFTKFASLRLWQMCLWGNQTNVYLRKRVSCLIYVFHTQIARPITTANMLSMAPLQSTSQQLTQ